MCTSICSPARANFYPRPPRGGRRQLGLVQLLPCLISIHALREEGDIPTSIANWVIDISIHALREEGDESYESPIFSALFISIHALREEGDQKPSRDRNQAGNFYPRPPRGGRLMITVLSENRGIFLSTPSARRATYALPSLYSTALKFLSTPSARRATCCENKQLIGDLFLSTPSARRATPENAAACGTLGDFYPRPPRGGRRELRALLTAICTISIHALREEGDNGYGRNGGDNGIFLSTPSARRATKGAGPATGGISHFYPRPPRGERLFVYF